VKIEAEDFPFVQDLPKRKQSLVERVWDRLKAFDAVVKEKGPVVTTRFAASLLGVSKQRIDQLMDAKKLERVDVDEHPFITQASIIELARSERKNGRPFKLPTTIREKWKVAREGTRRERTR